MCLVDAGVEAGFKLAHPTIGVSPGGVENLDPRRIEYPFEVMDVFDAATGEAAGVLDYEHVEVVFPFLSFELILYLTPALKFVIC